MGPVASLRSAFAKKFESEGRATRSEFWWMWFATMLISVVAGFIHMIFLHAVQTGVALSPILLGLELVAVVLILIFMIPLLFLTARRIHDANRSAWWMLLLLVPYGGLVVSLFGFVKGTVGPNRFGQDPRAID